MMFEQEVKLKVTQPAPFKLRMNRQSQKQFLNNSVVLGLQNELKQASELGLKRRREEAT